MIASRRNPLHELEDILARGSPAAEQPLTGDGDTLEDVDWVPATDVDRTDDAYHLRLEIPGVTRDEVAVTVEDGVLTVKGRKHAQARRIRQGRQTRRECLYGEFQRSFNLPVAIDTTAAEARLTNGLLLISLPWKHDPTDDIIEVKIQ